MDAAAKKKKQTFNSQNTRRQNEMVECSGD